MPIVDFLQDPAESFGTGNFRDDKGRVMYLHDPETAALFNKTIPGAPLAAKVKQESEDILDARTQPGASLGARVDMESQAIAQSRLGHQKRGPDLRLAQNAPDESSIATPGGPGAALVQGVADFDAAAVAPAAPAPGAPAPAAPVAPAGVPGAAPGAPAVGAAPGGPGAALVQGVNDFDAQTAARSKPLPPTAPPKPNPSGGLPLHSVRSGEGLSVEEGRPLANVLEQAGDEDQAFRTTEKLYRQQGRDKDKAVQAGLYSEIGGQQRAYGQSVDSAFRANAELRKAEAEQATIQRELKRNDESVDPDRYVRNMSTGKRISMIFLAALNGGFNSLTGQKNNAVLDALNEQINKDFETQKLQAASRRTSLSNDYKRYLDMGLDAKQAETLWRDRAFQALNGFKALEAKRIGALGEHEKAAEVFLAPLRQAAVQRRGEVLAQAEDKVKRTRDEGVTHEVPPPQLLTPQDMLAMLQLTNQRIANANTKDIEDAVGHPVTPEEAAGYRKDSQEYGKRLAVIAATRAQIAAVAKKVKLMKGSNGFEGNADPGVRPLGTSAFDEHARDVDREYALLKRADIMQMVREPSAVLQNEFGQITARPFNDSDIPSQLNTMDRLLSDAEKELRAGFSDEAVNFYTRKRRESETAPASPNKPAAKPGAKPTPAQADAAKERQRTQQMLEAPEGDLRSE